MDDVTIHQIRFNHDRNSITNDALTIRMNEKCEIKAPEWEDGQPSLPVAYARSQGNAMKIAVQLKKLNANVKSVQLSAQSDRLLGKVIAEKPVRFLDGALSEEVMLDLEGASLAEAGVGSWDISFAWNLIADTKPDTDKGIEKLTNHRVYTLLGLPNPPWWGPQNKDLEPPWAEMLEFACKWAAGAKTQTDAASMITEQLYQLGREKRLIFDHNMSFSRFALNGTEQFDLKDLLAKLKDGTQQVNCTDCAILVSTFANLLGCDLYQAQMGTDFRTNRIRTIGSDWEGRTKFEYHEVAWEDPCKDQARLFDCFLEVDGDPKTTAANEFEALLPVNMPFRDSREGGYHFRLVQLEDKEKCDALDSKIRREIGRKKLRVRSIDPRLNALVAEKFSFSSWKDLPFTSRSFAGPIDKLNEEFLSPGWERVHHRELQGEQKVLELRDSVWRSREAAGTAVRVLTYRCESVSDAQAFLLNLLGDFQIGGLVPRIKSQRAQEFEVGDLAFSDKEDRTILFVRSNVVVFLQNAGNNSISLLSIAGEVDREIRNVLDPAEIKLQEKTLMSKDFKNTVWSSITPPYMVEPVEPTDMKRTGRFKIKTHDLASGEVTGRYLDLKSFDEVDLKGSILFIGGDSYSIVLHHEVPGTEVRRYYRGQTIADKNKITVVAGVWKYERAGGTPEPNPKDNDVRAQDEGVWVATKP